MTNKVASQILTNSFTRYMKRYKKFPKEGLAGADLFDKFYIELECLKRLVDGEPEEEDTKPTLLFKCCRLRRSNVGGWWVRWR